MDVPLLDGIHHVEVPVTDLARSRDWYASRLGYEVDVEFEEAGRPVGLLLRHPRGGPRLALRLDPERSRRLAALGEQHAGVHRATAGWVLPLLHDPDGHEVRFYSTEHHSGAGPGEGRRGADPRESAERLDREVRRPSG